VLFAFVEFLQSFTLFFSDDSQNAGDGFANSIAMKISFV
jgi:hypothetical protein